MNVAAAIAALLLVFAIFSCRHDTPSYEEFEEPVVSETVIVGYTGIPTLYLELNRAIGDIDKENYVQGKMRLVYADGTSDFVYTFKEKKEGVKGRGNSSWGLPKKSYNIKFDKKQEFFGLPKAKKWCIIANYSDKTLLRNKFASVLGNDVLGKNGGEWNPHFESVDVVVNGEYRGNYLFGERITLTDGRVEVQDISKVKEDKNGDGKIDLADGGFIMEVDSRRDAKFCFDSNKGLPFTLKDPDEVGTDIQERVKEVVNTAEAALYGDNFADEAEGYAKYLDVNSFIDWYIVNEYAKNNDSIFFASVYIYYNPTDGKLHMGPNWDFDIGFGNVNYNGNDDPNGWWIKGTSWISRLFDDPAFVEKVKARWNAVRADIHSATNTTLPSLAAANKASAELNFECWQILGIYVWPNPAGYATRTTYQSEVDWMVDWLNKRYAWFDSAINGLQAERN